MTGVYKITNLINGDCYIGSSKDISYRWKQHMELYRRKGRHYQYHLYRAIRKFGIENFEFRILELCNEDNRIELEQKYYDMFLPNYNEIEPAQNPMECESVKRQQKLGCKTAWQNSSEEKKQKTLANLKKGWAEHSIIQKNPPKKVKAIRISDNEIFLFDSMTDAGRTLNISVSSISQIINPNHARKQTKGYRFVLQ